MCKSHNRGYFGAPGKGWDQNRVRGAISGAWQSSISWPECGSGVFP